MAYLISEDVPRSLITVTLHGSVDDDELMKLMEELYTLESYQLSDQFIDFSRVDHYVVTPGGLHHYSDAAKARPERAVARVDRKIVLYAPDDLTFGMARLLASIADSAGVKLWVFRDLAEALSLIGLSDNPTETTKNGTSDR